jgi:hypothetical protein
MSTTKEPKARANIDHALCIKLTAFLYASPMREHFKELKAKGWKFYVVSQTRGRCYFNIKTITIPSWVLRADIKRPGYLAWYCSHEMAHAYAGIAAKHGPMFMVWLKVICPSEYQQYELGYKPMHATSAGIVKQEINGGLSLSSLNQAAIDFEVE